MHSESIKEIVTALSKAQGVMEGASKSADNPFYHHKYADIASVWDAIRKPLSENGLSVAQTTTVQEGKIELTTTLFHISGEWISATLPVNPMSQKKDSEGGGWVPNPSPQAIGSAITYMRRYGLMAIVGVAPEEDDGNNASGRTAERRPEAKRPPEKKTPPPEQRSQEPPPEISAAEEELAKDFVLKFKTCKTIEGAEKGSLMNVFVEMQTALDDKKISQRTYDILYGKLKEAKVALKKAKEEKGGKK